MDFFKKGADMLKKQNNKTSEPVAGSSTAATTTTGAPVAGEQKQDYGDKAAGFLSKKSGHNMDPKTTEKVTDGARGLYEKFTGKKVDPKYSN